MYNALELLSGMGCVEMAMYPEKYNENLLREFYANLTVKIDKDDSPICGQVYFKGTIIAFSLANITSILSYPHYPEVEDTGFEGEVDLDEVARVLTGENDAF